MIGYVGVGDTFGELSLMLLASFRSASVVAQPPPADVAVQMQAPQSGRSIVMSTTALAMVAAAAQASHGTFRLSLEKALVLAGKSVVRGERERASAPLASSTSTERSAARGSAAASVVAARLPATKAPPAAAGHAVVEAARVRSSTVAQARCLFLALPRSCRSCAAER